MRVIYVDTLFFLNLSVDYLLLLLTARIGGKYPRRRRLLAGAAVGAVWSVILYFPPIPAAGALLLRLLVCAVTVMAAFGWQDRREWFRLCGLFGLMTFLLAGMALGVMLTGGYRLSIQNGVLYLDLSWGILAVSFLAVFGLSGLVLGKGRGGVSRCYHEIQIEVGGQQAQFRVLEDSGNLLQDPISGRKIIVVQHSALSHLWDKDCEGLCNGSGYPEEQLIKLREQYGLSCWLTPVHTAAGDGLLVAFQPERLWVDGKHIEGYLLGLTSQQLNIGGDCRGLMGV